MKFNVSMAAFSKGDSIILMHAEMHTDGSGGLDYSKLKAETLNGIKFTSREQCVTPADVPDSNPELLSVLQGSRCCVSYVPQTVFRNFTGRDI